MIIGTGLIAKIFDETSINFDENKIIYAKGVSNSNCIDDKQYNRDISDLKSFLKNKKDASIFYYISTCGVYSKNHNQYIKHKIECENIVREHKNAYIVRLPQVAGRRININNFCGYIYNAIMSDKRIVVHANAKRNIIDIEDVKNAMCHILYNRKKMPQIFNLAATKNFSVVYFVEEIEKILGFKLEKTLVEDGDEYDIDISSVVDIYSEINLKFDNSYPINTFVKYYLTAINGVQREISTK